MKTFVFIDASNLFYGGEKSLGWKIDYEKLFSYLQKKYEASRALYFGGVEIHDFAYNYLQAETVYWRAVQELPVKFGSLRAVISGILST